MPGVPRLLDILFSLQRSQRKSITQKRIRFSFPTTSRLSTRHISICFHFYVNFLFIQFGAPSCAHSSRKFWYPAARSFAAKNAIKMQVLVLSFFVLLPLPQVLQYGFSTLSWNNSAVRSEAINLESLILDYLLNIPRKPCMHL